MQLCEDIMLFDITETDQTTKSCDCCVFDTYKVCSNNYILISSL